ncbi:hypothetical protein [Streptomyces hokutonensis]|uniref:hypothetical protein n=1 Tax=Streptomyces hokutonensis TaxID=1306990 RepID=UPI00382EBCD4
MGEQREALQRLPEKRVSWLASAADAEAGKVRDLTSIAPESVKAVEDAVRAAYWSENSRASWSTVLREFLDEHPVYSIAAILLFMALSAQKLGPWLFGWGDIPDLGGSNTAVIIVYSLALVFPVHGRILAILGSVSSRLPVAWRLTSVTAAIYLMSWGGWRGDFRRWVMQFQGGSSKEIRYACQSADLLLVHILRFFVVFEFVWLTFSLLRVLTYKVGPKEPDDAVFSSRILLELLDLALLSQVASDSSRQSQPAEGFRPYLASSERREILESLDRVARIAGGRWKRSLRVGDRLVDSAVAVIGDGVAVSAGKWKVVAATGGERLPEMKQAFATALCDAAYGNWERLATEVSSKELLRRRVLRSVRHALALCTMLGVVYLVLLDPFSWLGKSANPAVNSFLLMFAAIVSITIDPTIVERLGNAAKVSGHFSSKK